MGVVSGECGGHFFAPFSHHFFEPFIFSENDDFLMFPYGFFDLEPSSLFFKVTFLFFSAFFFSAASLRFCTFFVLKCAIFRGAIFSQVWSHAGIWKFQLCRNSMLLRQKCGGSGGDIEECGG